MIFRAEERCQERSGENEKARSKMKRASVNNSRQRPTLPHTCACSTIGGGRLNFRVRNGNGCDPAPMTTGKLGVRGPTIRNAAISRTSSDCGSSRTISKNQPVSPPPRSGEDGQLNTLQTVVPLSHTQ